MFCLVFFLSRKTKTTINVRKLFDVYNKFKMLGTFVTCIVLSQKMKSDNRQI